MTRTRRPATIVLIAAIACLAAHAASAAYVWWEGEEPRNTSITGRNTFQPGDAAGKAVLSGGAWIGGVIDVSTTPAFIEYAVTVPETAGYRFYARKFWKHGPFRWRFDTQEWQTVTRDISLLDSARLAQHLVATWVYAGAVSLTAGVHTLRIEVLESGAACFDCFLLTTEPFIPRGPAKPDAPYPPPPSNWFNFTPAYDAFADTPLDLRGLLNEKEAGSRGFIRVRGESFVHADTGEPVRFWAVNAGPAVVRMSHDEVDHLARVLARKGVNLVRIHGPVYFTSGPKAGQPDVAYLDQLYYFVAAMKREGIYSLVSIYFQHWIRINELAQFPGYTEETLPFAIHFFHPGYQAMYQSWQKALLTATNRWTGAPLCDDPAVAFIEIINEDSLFFWTFDYKRIPAQTMALFEKQFGDWLAQRHGSIDTALKKWGPGATDPHDDPAAGRIGFVPLWKLFNTRGMREQDTARFLAETQIAFFKRMYSWIRDDCRFKGSIYASNWRTADDRYLGPIDKYCNTFADFMDAHGYFSPATKKVSPEFATAPGDWYDDRTAVTFQPAGGGKSTHDWGLPITDVIYNGMPATISEYAWTTPNRFRAEAPLLSASVASMLGQDAMIMFALDSVPGWLNACDDYYPIQTPTDMGQFPAAALIYRLGLLDEAKPAVVVNRTVESVMNLEGVPINAVASQDANRAEDVPKEALGRVDTLESIDPRAFFVGKVCVNFTSNDNSQQMIDLKKYIDEKGKVITSSTGQLRWDYGNGLVKIMAPKAQAAVGFLRAAGAIDLPDVTVETPMEYAAVALVAMDGRPIATSTKLLLQVMTEQQNSGWDAPGTGLREIKSLGAAPIIVRQFAGTVKLKRADAVNLAVEALDANGVPVGQAGTAAGITLKPDVLYYVLHLLE